jgi:hypothetical protein
MERIRNEAVVAMSFIPPQHLPVRAGENHKKFD